MNWNSLELHTAVERIHTIPRPVNDDFAWDFRDCVRYPVNETQNDDAFFANHVLPTLLADWVSYPSESDRVSLSRLHHVLSEYPAGFRTYLVHHENAWWPVGYYGFYPAPNSLYMALTADRLPKIDRETLLPSAETPHHGLYYVFNYSVAPQFIGTALTRRLLRDLNGALACVQPKALCAITVSEGGERVARRFGMVPVGTLEHDGKPETLLFGPWSGEQEQRPANS